MGLRWQDFIAQAREEAHGFARGTEPNTGGDRAAQIGARTMIRNTGLEAYLAGCNRGLQAAADRTLARAR